MAGETEALEQRFQQPQHNTQIERTYDSAKVRKLL